MLYFWFPIDMNAKMLRMLVDHVYTVSDEKVRVHGGGDKKYVYTVSDDDETYDETFALLEGLKLKLNANANANDNKRGGGGGGRNLVWTTYALPYLEGYGRRQIGVFTVFEIVMTMTARIYEIRFACKI